MWLSGREKRQVFIEKGIRNLISWCNATKRRGRRRRRRKTLFDVHIWVWAGACRALQKSEGESLPTPPPPPLPASSHADQMSEFRPFSFLFILGRCCFAFSASVSCARGNTLANEKSKKQTRIRDFYFRFWQLLQPKLKTGSVRSIFLLWSVVSAVRLERRRLVVAVATGDNRSTVKSSRRVLAEFRGLISLFCAFSVRRDVRPRIVLGRRWRKGMEVSEIPPVFPRFSTARFRRLNDEIVLTVAS